MIQRSYGLELAERIIAFNPLKYTADQWRARMRLLADINTALRWQRPEPNKSELPAKVRYILNYMPHDFPLRPDMNGPTTSHPIPWRVDENERGLRGEPLDSMQILGLEILGFWQFMQPSAAEMVARNAVTQHLSSMVAANSRFTSTDCRALALEVYGSVQSGSALTSSDIDLRVYSRQSDADMAHFGKLKRDFTRFFLDCIANDDNFILGRHRMIGWPIVNCQHRASGLDIQIVGTLPNHQRQALIKRYLQEIPLLFPLYAVIRTALSNRSLLEVFYGGPGSYTLLMMIVTVLLRDNAAHLPLEPQTLATHLLRFLEFYSQLDTAKIGLAVEPPAEFGKHGAAREIPTGKDEAEEQVVECRRLMSVAQNYMPWLLTLQDPADCTNDLGARVYAIKHLRRAFQRMREDLGAGLHRTSKDMQAGWANGRDPILLPVVGNCSDIYIERRLRIEAFGRDIASHEARVEATTSSDMTVSSPPLDESSESRIRSPFL